MRSVRLSVDEAWQVIELAHTGILTSLRADGFPIALPVWFVAIDRHIYVAGPTRTKKFSRIAGDPRVSFLVESGRAWAELVGVHVTGRATRLAAGPRADLVARALHEKYEAYRTPRSQMPDVTRDRYEVENATIEIVPDDRILTWDNSRLFAPGAG